MDLSTFDNSDFDRGASRAKELAWIVVSTLSVAGPVPGSGWRAALLRAFGAEIAAGVVLKPRVRVKFPWRLAVGRNSWIGEGVWIDNLAEVRVGRDACISQDTYLGTGNHDWTSPGFDLVTVRITIEDQCWVGARATVAPGTHMEAGAVLGIGAVASGRLKGWTVYGAGKAIELGARREKPAGDGA
ncbi:WcaF family extracellular polysaccharide biosynthesis acetyltransferase [Acuticoccus kandeliae]|uniref:WcaF family extracellular polysaccharide biosynthesis acetyltransferase n=1 Tax=Acuticoccus kandeliae TaxID=2073160 RepID=UPI000D3EA46D|nr:WcaF family extracellular polysaccharide biosynthesis acetyltransferase [Acuticoccus kandeliae]